MTAGRHESSASASTSDSTPGSTSSVSASASEVSSPSIPAGASSNGRSFCSTGCGAWSVAMASMVPSARPRLIAATSASVRSGGCTLNTGSKLAQHSSVRVKWCGAASAVIASPRAFAARTSSTAPAVDTCRKCTRAPVSSARIRSRATMTSSAAAGRPGMPRRLDQRALVHGAVAREPGVLGVLRRRPHRVARASTRARGA